tara:strand:+ start:196 stop:753 length:558 start_codon:yes stop_codon:yes gene_type:complete
MVTPVAFLSAPIPGQSLTNTPGNYPFEKPPEMVTKEEVAKYYIDKLSDQEVMDDLSVVFNAGMSVSSFVKTLMSSGFMFGKHTVQAGMLAAPVVHAYVKAAMSTYGIEAKDEPFDPKEEMDKREKARTLKALELALIEADDVDDAGATLLEEMQQAADDEATVQEKETIETTPAESSKGLMAKEV